MEKQKKNKRIPYFRLCFKSFAQFFKNPVVILPSLIQLVMFLGLALLVIIELFILYLVNGSTNLFQPVLAITILNCAILICFITVDILGLIYILTYPPSMRIGMIKEIVDNGKTSRKNMWLSGKRYFTNYLKCFVIIFFIEFIHFIFFLILNKIFPGFVLDIVFYFTSYYGLLLGVLIFLGISSVFFIIFELLFFFFEPVLIHKNESSGFKEILISVLKYANKHPFHLLITWFMVFVLTNGIALIICIVAGILDIDNGLAIIGIVILLIIVNYLIDLVIKIFVFHSYFCQIRSQTDRTET